MADAQRATTHDLGRWTSLRLPGRLLITTTVLLLLMICYFREWLTTYTSPLLLGSYLVVGLTLPLAIHHALVVRFWVMRRSDVKALIVPIVGYALFIFVVLIERAHQSIGDAHMSVGVIGLLMLLPIWAWFGFLAARSTQNAYWLGTILSAIIAAAAFASYVMRQTGIAYEPIITPARWPMRLVFLFAYLWHLSAWLGGKRKGRHASIIAVLACVPELMLTMHKPVLLATMVGTSIVVLPHLASRRILLRLVPAIGLSVVALIVLNWASGNAIAARAQNAIVRSWLHVDAGMASEHMSTKLAERLLGGRLRIWSEMMEPFGESPWVGSGLGHQYQLKKRAQTVSAHNTAVDLLLGVGVLGVLPIAVVTAWWITRATLTVLRAPGLPAAIQWIAVAYFIGLSAYGVGGALRSFMSPLLLLALLFGASIRLRRAGGAPAARQTQPPLDGPNVQAEDTLPG